MSTFDQIIIHVLNTLKVPQFAFLLPLMGKLLENFNKLHYLLKTQTHLSVSASSR